MIKHSFMESQILPLPDLFTGRLHPRVLPVRDDNVLTEEVGKSLSEFHLQKHPSITPRGGTDLSLGHEQSPWFAW